MIKLYVRLGYFGSWIWHTIHNNLAIKAKRKKNHTENKCRAVNKLAALCFHYLLVAMIAGDTLIQTIINCYDVRDIFVMILFE